MNTLLQAHHTGPRRRESFRDMLEEKWRSSDLSHALRNFTPTPYKGEAPCSVKVLNRTVLESQYLRYVIRQMSKESREPEEVFREEAAGLLEEMAQNLKLGYIRLMAFMLSKIFKRLFRRIKFNDEGLQKLQQAISESPVILLPNHRSYVDFLVLSYILFTYDLSVPVIAAGIPLMDMQMVGEILRRSGAFFIRRSIGDDKLYWAVLSEYVRTLVKTGFSPVEFFVEGLRSRTLKSSMPKLGMMHMVLEPFFKGEVFDVTLVPITISYERVLEESLLAHELLGVSKPKESTTGLLKARRVLEEDYGTMHVYFGNPVSVREMAELKIKRRHYNLIPRDLPMTPSEDIQEFVSTTAHMVVRLQEKNAVLNPWSLMATILMQNLNGLDLKLLTKQTLWLKGLVLGFGALLDWPDGTSSSDVLASSLSLHRSVVRWEDGWVRLVQPAPQEVGSPEERLLRRAVNVLMCASHRNQTVHVLVRPALVALAMHVTGSTRRDNIFAMFTFLRDVFSNEFIFVPGNGAQDFEEGCSLLVKCGAVQIAGQLITETENGHATVSFLRAVIESFRDAYQAVFRHLCVGVVQDFTEKDFISSVRTFALGLLLSGELTSYDALSSDTQKNVLSCLQRFGAVKKMTRGVVSYFTTDKAAVEKISDILAGELPPPSTSTCRL